MGRYVWICISVFLCSFIVGYGLLSFVEVPLDAILMSTILIIAMLSVIITLLIKINDTMKKSWEMK